MPYLVRYHRSIVDPSGRVVIPSGTVLEDLSKVPSAQQDRVIVVGEDHASVKEWRARQKAAAEAEAKKASSADPVEAAPKK